ncbi:MAG: hypothetical protein ACLUN0_00075 [Roseburia sp.]
MNSFSSPVTAEIVAVNENLYTNALQGGQDIQNLFILSEHQEQGRTEELSVSRVYKYYGIKELYNELTYKSQERLEGKSPEKERLQLSRCIRQSEERERQVFPSD